jgi:hypothetical protein
MGRSSPQTHAKRQREQTKRDKRHAKDERKAARKAARDSTDTESTVSEHPAEDIQPIDSVSE